MYRECTGFVHVAYYTPEQRPALRHAMTARGLHLKHADIATMMCPACGAWALVGGTVFRNNTKTPFWLQGCAACGVAWVEKAIYEVFE